VHRTTLKVRFYELDPYGHANHSAYIQWFEAARVEALAEVGWPIDRMLADGIAVVVTRLVTDFVRSAMLGEELTIESSLGAARRVTATWHQEMFRADELICRQSVDVAALTRDGKPRRWPDGLVAALTT
jgi:acyl-CoA thioester hydrolase